MKGGVVVTGGTGELGRAVVQELLGRGWRVAVPFRDPASFEPLRAAGAWGAAADLTSEADARRFFDEAAGPLDGVGGLAAVAGAYAGSGPFESAPEDEWTMLWRANVETARVACRAALPHLLRAGGSVVTVASRLAERPAAGSVAYATTKATVLAMTRALAVENAGRGVRFNCVVPGTIDTPANRRAMPGADTSGWTSPAAIARVVAFLLGPESGAVTGAAVPVDVGHGS